MLLFSTWGTFKHSFHITRILRQEQLISQLKLVLRVRLAIFAYYFLKCKQSQLIDMMVAYDFFIKWAQIFRFAVIFLN